MTVMVTGARGRIGGHVLRQLLDRGVEVCGIDIGGGRRRGTDAEHVAIDAVDIRDLASLIRYLRERRVDRVIHLAAVFGAPSDRHPRTSLEVNLGGTLNVLEAARFCRVERVVMASSHSLYPPATGVYGPPTWKPIDESHPPVATRPYTIMKLACEQLGAVFARQHGVEFAALRFASFYGAERAVQRGNSLSDTLNRMIIDAFEGFPIRLEWDEGRIFDPVYIKDCAHGVLCAALSDTAPDGHVYNIGGGRAVTLREAAEAVRKAVPGAEIEIDPNPRDTNSEGPSPLPWLDIGRANQEIGYHPQYDLEAGVLDCISELRALPERT